MKKAASAAPPHRISPENQMVMSTRGALVPPLGKAGALLTTGADGTMSPPPAPELGASPETAWGAGSLVL